MIVYCATSPSGKQYIGITRTSLKKRQISHKCQAKAGKKTKFYDALRKYEVDGLEWKILKEVDTIEELLYWEKYYIRIYNTVEKGYNQCEGGIGYTVTKDKPFSIYNKQGLKLGTYIDKLQCAQDFNLDHHKFSYYLKHRDKGYRSYKGYILMYDDQYDPGIFFFRSSGYKQNGHRPRR